MKILKYSTTRFVIVGGFLYLADFLVYWILVKLSINPLIANFCGKIIGAFIGFFGHRYFTFQVIDKKLLLKHSLKYIIITLVYAPFSSLVLNGVFSLISNRIIAKIISDTICIVISFLLSKFAIFTHGDKNGN